MIRSLSVYALIILVSACGTMLASSNKTPLTPMGELNACILEQVKEKIQNESSFTDVKRTANQVANYCIRKLDMLDSGLYGQAAVNAMSILNSYKK